MCSGLDVLAFGPCALFVSLKCVSSGTKKICCVRVIDVVRVWLSCMGRFASHLSWVWVMFWRSVLERVMQDWDTGRNG